MTLETFIRHNRKEIDQRIRAASGPKYMPDDIERMCWLEVNQELWAWARKNLHKE